MPPRAPVRRVTTYEDPVARVDMGFDEDGDVEIVTLFREGNRWLALEAAPTALAGRDFLAGLLRLGLLGIGVEDVEPLALVLDRTVSGPPLAEALRVAAKAAEVQQGYRRGP